MAKSLLEIQTFLNTKAFDFDTLKSMAQEKGFELKHYLTNKSIYVLENQS